LRRLRRLRLPLPGLERHLVDPAVGADGGSLRLQRPSPPPARGRELVICTLTMFAVVRSLRSLLFGRYAPCCTAFGLLFAHFGRCCWKGTAEHPTKAPAGRVPK